MIYRYAEVLLDYVECLVETGEWQNPDVEKYINMIRNRAGMPNMDKSVYNTQEKVRELYRRERRIEFALRRKNVMMIFAVGKLVMKQCKVLFMEHGIRTRIRMLQLKPVIAYSLNTTHGPSNNKK